MVSVALIQAIFLCQKNVSGKKDTFFSTAESNELCKLANAKHEYTPSFKMYAFVLHPAMPQF